MEETNQFSAALASAIKELADASGMTVNAFLFGGIATVLEPFEKRIADRVCDTIEARFKKTAEIGKKNDDLEKDWNRVATGGL